MTAKQILSALPEVKIGVKLPEIPDGTILLPFASPWRHAEHEFALGIITTVAIRNGKWCPVDVREFGIIMDKLHGTHPQNIINAVWAMADEGYLDIVTVEGKDFIVPHTELAEVLGKCTLRYM